MSGFQPSYPGARDYSGDELNQGVWGVNAGADKFGGTVGMGANPDFNAIAGPGANNVWGVNSGANGFGSLVGLGPNPDYNAIAGPGATAGTPPTPPPAPAGLTAADQAFADQVRQMYGTGSGQQLAMGNQMGPGGYAFARPNGAGGFGPYNPLGGAGGGGGMPGMWNGTWGGMGGGGMQGSLPPGLLDWIRQMVTQYGIK